MGEGLKKACKAARDTRKKASPELISAMTTLMNYDSKVSTTNETVTACEPWSDPITMEATHKIFDLLQSGIKRSGSTDEYVLTPEHFGDVRDLIHSLRLHRYPMLKVRLPEPPTASSEAISQRIVDGECDSQNRVGITYHDPVKVKRLIDGYAATHTAEASKLVNELVEKLDDALCDVRAFHDRDTRDAEYERDCEKLREFKKGAEELITKVRAWQQGGK